MMRVNSWFLDLLFGLSRKMDHFLSELSPGVVSIIGSCYQDNVKTIEANVYFSYGTWYCCPLLVDFYD
ncbi:hypothetical protein Lser_V15G11119 [Lactuca serriola]